MCIRDSDWLMNKHRKAVSVAITERLFDELSPEEEEALTDLPGALKVSP